VPGGALATSRRRHSPKTRSQRESQGRETLQCPPYTC
jgi:hypothetical protein